LSATFASDEGAAHYVRPIAANKALDAASFDRDLDLFWRRTSYTALTAAAHDAVPVIASEPEIEEKDDEPETVASEPGAPSLHVLSPMNDLPGGAAFGTFVHSVLEQVDPEAADLRSELQERVGAESWRMDGIDRDAVVEALVTALDTPLGEVGGNRPLAAVARTDRLPELEFELPLRGGDRPNGVSRLGEVGELLRRHLPPDDPLAGYADVLGDPLLADAILKGYLTGSIDAVLRIDGRYVVVDYKTNRLGAPEVPLTSWDYRPAALRDAMIAAHYPLQALLYEVALHRFLRWRVGGYDPTRHLGGVLYLFLRGMCGPDARLADGAVPGVLAWRPPAALVVAISDLLAGGAQ
jgi:exodeoxyribonuclease V beta subunit